jgi:hypothetical protein
VCSACAPESNVIHWGDGKRFLILKDPPSALQAVRHLEVVPNWPEDLRRLTEPAK